MDIGKVSGNVLKRSVLGQMNTKREEMVNGAGMGVDCAIFSCGHEEGVTACMQEAPVCLGTELPAKQEVCMTLTHLIQKCANNLAAGGSAPYALMLTLLLPEGTEESELREFMWEAAQASGQLSMELIGGQTRISAEVKVPFAITAGYGKLRAGCEAKVPSPGQDIVISKWIGLQGTALLAKRYGKGLGERYPSYLIEEARGFDRYLSVIPEAEAAVKSGVCAMHDVSEGGIFAALWELAEGAGVGLNIDMRKLPLRQETVEVCEFCNVNPYELLSGGCLIMTTNDGQGLVDALGAEHIPAVIVGRVTEGRKRILRNGEEIRYLDRPRQDQIYKALHNIGE